MSEKITLSGVPETMLQTVYARAKETKTRGAITDNKAVEIIDRLDYDFSMADKDAAMHSGVIARTIVLDKLVKTYLAGHGGAVVVNIACGLDTRCYRMSGYAHWYNLDLPETIAVREKLLPESRKISQITMSAMDDWGGEIKGTSTDVLVIIEGLTMYLSESDVKRIFDVIAARFDRATVLVETMNPMVVKRFKEKSIEASKAKFTWGVKNGAALAALLPDFRFVEEHSLCEGMAEFVSPMDQIITTCSIKFATRRALRRCWIASSSKTSCRRCRFCESEEKRMKRNYIIAAFRETVAQQFPEQSVELNRLLDEKLSRLRSMHLNASKGKQFHLESQILPGIAAYETLQTVMPKDEALQTVHGYVAEHAWTMRKTILKLLRVPGIYRLPPVLFSKLTPKFYGETAGFAATEYQTSGGVWRIDMTKCPYHDTCVEHGCPELCPCFCDSDDIAYDDLHPKLVWHRTKTLGRGNECCDFCLKLAGK